jgi:hypothetical protein
MDTHFRVHRRQNLETQSKNPQHRRILAVDGGAFNKKAATGWPRLCDAQDRI